MEQMTVQEILAQPSYEETLKNDDELKSLAEKLSKEYEVSGINVAKSISIERVAFIAHMAPTYVNAEFDPSCCQEQKEEEKDE